MNFILDQLIFLGLNEREIQVFTALSTFGRMNMTRLAKRAGLARTTVDAIVRRLVEQGLVEQEKVGGHHEYVVKLEEVANTLDRIENRFRPVRSCEDKTDSDNNKTEYSLKQKQSATSEKATDCNESGVSSHNAMHTMVEKAFTQHVGERSTMLVASLVTSEKRMKRFEHCLKHAREAEMNLEVLITVDVAKDLSKYAKELLALLSSYDLRLNFLPPSFCFEYLDMLAFRDLVLIIDHHTDALEYLEGKRAVASINHLLMVARESGWGMDMKLWLEGVESDKEIL